MGIFKDFKEFYQNKHNGLIQTNKLYVCKFGTFTSTRQNSKILTEFEPNGFKIMEVLTPKETQKYLKKQFGSWSSGLPEYHNYSYSDVTYYKIPNSNEIFPSLTLQQAANRYGNSYVGVYQPKLVSTLSSNLPEYISLEQIKELEIQINDKYQQSTMGR